MNAHIEVYQGRRRFRQAWRWRLVAENGDKLANGGEAYTNRADMDKIQAIEEFFPDLSVVEL